MKVIALTQGFHGGAVRAVGETFDVADGSRATWYAPLDTAPKVVKAKPKKDEPQALSQLGKEPAQSFNDTLA